MDKSRRSQVATASSEPSLGSRVHWLISQVHDGNVSKAAQAISEAIGVPVGQPTLARILHGENIRPKPETIRAICLYYGVTSDWLLYGDGVPPQAFPSAADIDWTALLRSLALSPESVRALERLIQSSWLLGESLRRQHRKQLDQDQIHGIDMAMREFSLNYRENWRRYLKALVASVGAERVTHALTPAPQWLLNYQNTFDTNRDLVLALEQADAPTASAPPTKRPTSHPRKRRKTR